MLLSPPRPETLQLQIIKAARIVGAPFQVGRDPRLEVESPWRGVWRSDLLDTGDIETLTLEELVDKLSERWQKFLRTELVPITQAVAALDW